DHPDTEREREGSDSLRDDGRIEKDARADDPAHDRHRTAEPPDPPGVSDRLAAVGAGHAAALRSAAIFGARLFGLSRLNERASPSSSPTNRSASFRAASRARSLTPNVAATIDSVSGSYSQSPIRRPRSRMACAGKSAKPAIAARPFSLHTFRRASSGSRIPSRERRCAWIASRLLTRAKIGFVGTLNR